MSKIILTEDVAPPTPATGRVVIYPKADGLLYSKDDSGVEVALGVVGGGTGDFKADGSVPMTADIDLGGFNLTATGVAFFAEQATADADVAGYGQIWVKDTTPCELWFTDDAGTDVQLGIAGGGSGDLLADGTVPLTANWDVGAFTITGTQFISDIVTGTAPLVVASTTEVANLKAATATLAASVTTNADLTGHVTSTGNAAVLGSFTVAQLNTAISDATLSGSNTGDQTNITGNAATVTTNADLTGPVTSTGNATAIADKAIALAKLADGTAGNLITYDAAGVIAAVATGTAAQVLTSNGVGVAPTFQAAAGGAVATDAIWDAAGDLAVGTGANTAAKLSMGTTLQQIRVNAGATALEYFTPAAAGDFLANGTVDMSGEFRTDVGTMDSDVADGASANAWIFNNANTFSTAGGNLLQIQNNGTPVFDFSFQGGIDHKNSGATTAAHAQSLNMNWQSGGANASSGQYSCVIGQNNKASGYASMAVGRDCGATGDQGFASGYICNATGNSSVALGYANTASGNASIAVGHSNNSSGLGSLAAGVLSKAELGGSFALSISGFGTAGYGQTYILTPWIATTDATQTTLTLNGSAVVINPDTTWAFSALIVARSDEADGNLSMVWKIEGCLTRDESNNTALVGTPTTTVIANGAAAAWSVDAVADDTNEALAIRCTGEAATNIRWVAKVDIAQVTYA